MSQRHPASEQPYFAAIVGSGFAGLCMAIRLKQAGIDDFLVLEKADDVGGTWRDNHYPGAACDVQSHLYSFSFAPKHDWSRKYGLQDEIHDYLRQCARDFGILPHIRFNTELSEAEFDEHAGEWCLCGSNGEHFRARALISACGQLNRPAVPDIPGLSDFSGTQFHSARWDKSCDLRGKRVAVIGTGASAIQFVPPLAEQVAQLQLYQRSAPWVIPKRDRRFGRVEQWLFKHFPGYDRLYRLYIYCRIELRALAFVGGALMMPLFEWLAKRHLRRQVRDPALRQRLTPDYPIGCKRVLIANDYYPALNQPHVEVVTDAIEKIEGQSIVTASGKRREVDAIVFGTGFKATDFLAPMRITGLDGRELQQEWQDGAEAYKGISVNGFPNLFLLYGPNTNLAHNSIVFMIESQVRYILRCLTPLRDKRYRYLDVRAEVQRRYNNALQRQLENTVWQTDCHSWYKTEAGKNTNNWPGFTVKYRLRTRRPNPADYLWKPWAELATEDLSTG